MVEQNQCYQVQVPNTPLQAVQNAIPHLTARQILVRITHCGVCHSDLHMVENDWGDSEYPLIPGHEIVGTVAKIGSQVDQFKVGDRVGISWQQDSCGHCQWCQGQQEEFCPDLKAVGIGCQGGFADYCCVSQDFAFHIPKTLSSAGAAPLLCAGATVFNALTQYQVGLGMTVGIIGIGGLGHLAIQIATAMGAQVYGFTRSEKKVQQAAVLGAKKIINYETSQALKPLHNQFDLLVTTVPEAIDYTEFLFLLAPKKTLCVLGMPKERLAIPVFPLIVGQRSICGLPLGNRQTLQAMLSFAAHHGIEPKVTEMPMTEVNRALTMIKHNQANFRIVLSNCR